MTALLVMAGNVLTMSLRQALIPEELFGRVQGAWRTLVRGGIPIGGMAGGALAAATDVPTVFVVAGTTILLVGIGIAGLLYRTATCSCDDTGSRESATMIARSPSVRP